MVSWWYSAVIRVAATENHSLAPPVMYQARPSSTFGPAIFKATDQFEDRHLGPSLQDEKEMLKTVGEWLRMGSRRSAP